ncbi:MAG TPA: ABC transporter substrate-binding protein [Microlunatus sp.]|nr:ABC transporter substrate-binding protein [Microlunatus sp.]
MPARARWASLVAGVLLLASACTSAGDPQPEPSQSTPTPRPLVVLSTDPIRQTDPAAITDPGSMVLSLNVFQRLMTSEPGQAALKPDAAKDCLFTANTVYTCTLNPNLTFHNGHALTSSDVKFSIQRALRLDVAGSSASLLSTLRRIETPDPLTVRFVLSEVDTQFGWALASPAASIVDEQVYNADEVRPRDQPIEGSGPFSVTGLDDSELRLQRNPTYQGRTPPRMDSVVYRTVADSAALEDALKSGTADVIWRGLSAAAVTRYSRQASISEDDTTDAGYGLQTQVGTRVLMLAWSPTSSQRSNDDLRNAITVALQGDRTLDSVVPGGIPNHISAFPLGGSAKPDITWSNRIQLTLGYDPTMPDGRDTATRIRTRLEDTGGMSVRLRAVDPAAETDNPPDLMVLDRKAWTSTGLAWMQPYLDAPLPDSADEVASLEQRYRSATEEGDAARAMASLQRKAAGDAVLVPLTQSDEYVLTAPQVQVPANCFGPGWQLGLWGMTRG